LKYCPNIIFTDTKGHTECSGSLPVSPGRRRPSSGGQLPYGDRAILAIVVMMLVFDAVVAGVRPRVRLLGALGRAGSAGCAAGAAHGDHGRVVDRHSAGHKEISGFAAITNGTNLPILLVAGVLLPISHGPAWMRVLAHVNPLYHLVQASRALADGTPPGPAVWQASADHAGPTQPGTVNVPK
jgi:hypothetical protein